MLGPLAGDEHEDTGASDVKRGQCAAGVGGAARAAIAVAQVRREAGAVRSFWRKCPVRCCNRAARPRALASSRSESAPAVLRIPFLLL
jgi:hypothetical protein